MEEYYPEFMEAGVNEAGLANLGWAELKAMKIPIGPRLAILNELKKAGHAKAA